jgi:DNA-binding transcriptional LysR family regulator
MDLRQLRYFLAVAEERSVTRAAGRLHLTQPPLSAQLARLEHELGVELFVRHRRGVSLTAAGEQLRGHAERILGELERARGASWSGSSTMRSRAASPQATGGSPHRSTPVGMSTRERRRAVGDARSIRAWSV